MPATQPTIASLGATAETRLPRALRVPRAMLLALTIIYLARGEFFVIRLAERVREGAGENVESRVNSALLGLERMTDRFERMATVLAAEPAVVEAFRAAGRGADAGPSLTAAARPILETADAQGVTYLDANGHALRVSGQDSVGLATLPTLPDFLTTATAQRAAFSQVVPSAVPALDIGGRRRQGGASPLRQRACARRGGPDAGRHAGARRGRRRGERAAAGDPYRVVILDYLMPAMDGEMLGRAIRADERLRGCALILATSDMRSRRTDGVTPVRVLLAEDNPVNQTVAVRMLERLGCRTDVAQDGAEALRLVETNDYDIVFMDVQMPNMDGLEATRRLRASERGRRLHVVAMTANAMQGDRERCIDAGMDDYVPKPVTPDYLARALEALTPART